MFASRAITVAQTGHRYTPSAKFTATRQVQQELHGKRLSLALTFIVRSTFWDLERYRLPESEDETHPHRTFLCALISFLFCPLVGRWHCSSHLDLHWTIFFKDVFHCITPVDQSEPIIKVFLLKRRHSRRKPSVGHWLVSFWDCCSVLPLDFSSLWKFFFSLNLIFVNIIDRPFDTLVNQWK